MEPAAARAWEPLPRFQVQASFRPFGVWIIMMDGKPLDTCRESRRAYAYVRYSNEREAAGETATVQA